MIRSINKACLQEQNGQYKAKEIGINNVTILFMLLKLY